MLNVIMLSVVMLSVVLLNVVARAKAKARQVKIGNSINNSGEKGFSHFVVKTMTPRARTVKLFTVVSSSSLR